MSIVEQIGEWSALEIFGLTVAVIIAFSILIWSIFRIRAMFWEDEGPAEEPHEMLIQFRDLHRQGDLTEEEYRSIKGRLADSNKLSRTPPTENR